MAASLKTVGGRSRQSRQSEFRYTHQPIVQFAPCRPPTEYHTFFTHNVFVMYLDNVLCVTGEGHECTQVCTPPSVPAIGPTLHLLCFSRIPLWSTQGHPLGRLMRWWNMRLPSKAQGATTTTTTAASSSVRWCASLFSRCRRGSGFEAS